MKYSLFYSWQSDKPEARTLISEALKEAQKQLREENIQIEIDQDTRDRIGTEDIGATVLQKIRDCDIFLGDLTPVTSIVGSNGSIKIIPNSNVMYEFGYAEGVKGANRAILVAFLSGKETISQLPFDINHYTITEFNSNRKLFCLASRIKGIVNAINAERANITPSYDCSLLFESLTEETQIRPLYKREFNGFKDLQSISPDLVIPFKVMSFAKGHFSGRPFNSNGAFAQPLSKEVNKSISAISLVFSNIGKEALENSKLIIKATEPNVEILDSDTENYLLPSFRSIYDPMDINDNIVTVDLKDVNPGDKQTISPFYLFVPYSTSALTLSWDFSSKRFRKSGELRVVVDTQYKDYFYPEKEPQEVIISEYISRE